MSSSLTLKVLYCHRDNLWKLADFGLTTEATSNQAVTTRYSRGTGGYRAPELLSEDPKFTNKIDIWALGCILYELVAGKRAFRDDYSVYGRVGLQLKLDIPIALLPKAFESHFEEFLGEILERDPQKRPKVSTLRILFESYCLILSPSIVKASDDVESIPPYNIWKELIRVSAQDDEVVLSGLVNWYESNRGNETMIRLLEVLIIIPESAKIAGTISRMVSKYRQLGRGY